MFEHNVTGNVVGIEIGCLVSAREITIVLELGWAMSTLIGTACVIEVVVIAFDMFN
jgi:hypothetical protein